MNTIKRLLQNKITGMIFLCLPCIIYGQNINTGELNVFFERIEKNNLGTGAVSIYKNGVFKYGRSFGENGTVNVLKNNKNVKYRIGSITKMLTAIITYQLYGEGQLNLDEPISKYFPSLPNAGKITIRHLLSHSGGLKDFVFKDSLYFWLTEPVTEDEIFNEINRQGIAFMPGDSVLYSNSGYFILTEILEKKCGKKYGEILSERITEPLGLISTVSGANDDDGIARSYRINTQGGRELIKEFYFPNVTGLGDVASTPDELNVIIYALFSSVLTDSSVVNNMKSGDNPKFGSGMMKFPVFGKMFYGHRGDTFGTHSIVMYNPEDGISVAVCLNRQAIGLSEILKGILSIIYGTGYDFPDISVQKRQKISAVTLDTYSGNYLSDKQPLKIRILREGDNLLAQIAPEPPFVLEFTGGNSFRNLAAGAEMIFDTEKGRLVLKLRGEEIIFQKKQLPVILSLSCRY